MHDTELMTSVKALAAGAARSMAEKSMINYELREAMHTEKLQNGVRIGDWDIITRLDGDERLYDIHKAATHELLVSNVAFYDAAHRIVNMLLHGHSHRSQTVQKLVLINDEYRRARSDAITHGARSEFYYAKGKSHRAFIAEDRQLEASRRARTLRYELLA